MEGMGAEACRHGVICQLVAKLGAVAPFFWFDLAHGQQRSTHLESCPIASCEVGAARPSSAEVFLRAVESERMAIYDGEETLSDRQRQTNAMKETGKL